MTRRFVVSVWFATAATVLSAVTVVTALGLASGITRGPGDVCCHTEFIDGNLVQLVWLTVPLLAVAAYHSLRIALLGILGATLPAWWAMRIAVNRYTDTGWGDGLEVLGYLLPLGVTVLSIPAVLVGALVARRRPRQDQ